MIRLARAIRRRWHATSPADRTAAFVLAVTFAALATLIALPEPRHPPFDPALLDLGPTTGAQFVDPGYPNATCRLSTGVCWPLTPR